MDTDLYRRYTKEQLEAHAIMYMKQWYIQNNIIADLKVIQGLVCWFEPKYISDMDLFRHFLFPIYKKYVTHNQMDIGDFIAGAYDQFARWMPRLETKKTLGVEDFIDFIVREIRSNVMAKDIAEWPMLDSDILPYEPEKYSKWEEMNKREVVA